MIMTTFGNYIILREGTFKSKMRSRIRVTGAIACMVAWLIFQSVGGLSVCQSVDGLMSGSARGRGWQWEAERRGCGCRKGVVREQAG